MIVSPEFLFNVIDNLHLGIIITNKNGELRRINKALLGYLQMDGVKTNGHAAAVKQEVESIIAQTKLPQAFDEAIREIKNIKTYFEYDFKINSKGSADSIRKFFRVDIYPVTDGNNFPDGVVAMLTDITPVNEYDAHIKTSLLNLKTVINNARYGIYTIDTSYNYIEFNKTYAADYKRLFSADIKIGDNALNENMPAGLINDWKQLYERALAGNKIEQHYYFNGEPYHITLNPITDHGRVTGITVFAENIKDDLQLRDDYRESRFLHKFAMDVSNSGFWDWDMTTNEIHFSSIWLSMLGYDNNDVEQSYYGWERLVHRDDLPKAIAAISQHVSGQTSTFKLETRMLCKNGNYKWVLATGRIVETLPGGKPKRFLGVLNDIDYIKSTELDLKKRNEQLNEVAYITSHGVRKSLANILGLTQVIDLGKFADPGNREMMSQLLKAADELNEETIRLNKAMKHLNKDLFKDEKNTPRQVKNIMVVDDDPINNLITSKYVQKAGLTSIIFESPVKALDYLNNNNNPRPDVILLDINMPEMTGFEFLKAMDKYQLTFDVIILTSSISLQDRNHASEFKAVIDFWVKPLSFSKIMALSMQPQHT